jgi:hypothetical protein
MTKRIRRIISIATVDTVKKPPWLIGIFVTFVIVINDFIVKCRLNNMRVAFFVVYLLYLLFLHDFCIVFKSSNLSYICGMSIINLMGVI